MGHDLHNNLLESGLSQHVSKPTRGDNILHGPEFSTSDHKIVSFNIHFKIYKDNVSEELIFMYCKGNFEKLRKILADTDCSIVEN